MTTETYQLMIIMMKLMMSRYSRTNLHISDSNQRVTWFPCQLFEPEMQPYVGNLSRPDVGNGILCIVAHARALLLLLLLLVDWVPLRRRSSTEMDHPGFPVLTKNMWLTIL